MKTETLQDYKRRMQQVLNHIQQHLDDPLPLDDLASLACFSSYHFHRVFTGMVGESVGEYVRRLRMERAASRLKHGTASVLEIALASGYESHEAFTRSFRLYFGQSPSEFRSVTRAAIASSPSGIHYDSGIGVKHFRSQRGGNSMGVVIKQLNPMRVAYLSHVGPYNEVGETWDRLTTTLGKEGFLGGDQLIFGICYDDPAVTAPEKIRYDACITVNEHFQPFNEIGVKIVDGGEFAITTHKGPYSELGNTYNALYGVWLPRSGREMRDSPALEIYLNSPETTEPSELLTDIYAPLKPMKGAAE